MNTAAAHTAGGHCAEGQTVRTHARRRSQAGRTASVVESIVVVVLIVAVILAAAVANRGSVAIGETTAIRVHAGDTLWEIAVTHPIKGATTHEAVAAISELNSLDGGDLRVGQTLRVPAVASADVALAKR